MRRQARAAVRAMQPAAVAPVRPRSISPSALPVAARPVEPRGAREVVAARQHRRRGRHQPRPQPHQRALGQTAARSCASGTLTRTLRAARRCRLAGRQDQPHAAFGGLLARARARVRRSGSPRAGRSERRPTSCRAHPDERKARMPAAADSATTAARKWIRSSRAAPHRQRRRSRPVIAADQRQDPRGGPGSTNHAAIPPAKATASHGPRSKPAPARKRLDRVGDAGQATRPCAKACCSAASLARSTSPSPSQQGHQRCGTLSP